MQTNRIRLHTHPSMNQNNSANNNNTNTNNILFKIQQQRKNRCTTKPRTTPATRRNRTSLGTVFARRWKASKKKDPLDLKE